MLSTLLKGSIPAPLCRSQVRIKREGRHVRMQVTEDHCYQGRAEEPQARTGPRHPAASFSRFLSSVYETRSGEVATEDAPRQQPNAAAGLGLRLRRRTTLI